MMQLRFVRDTTAGHGHFTSTREFQSHNGLRNRTSPAYLCAGATTRLFKLPPKSKRCAAKFTKQPPRNCSRYYSLNKGRRFSEDIVVLKEFSGSFMGGVESALKVAWNEGYRFVRIEP